MNIYCGSTKLSDAGCVSSKLSGNINITAPHIIKGGVEIMTDLSLGGVINIPAPHTDKDSYNIPVYFTEEMTETFSIAGTLSAMDSASQKVRIHGANSINKSSTIATTTSSLLAGSAAMSTTLGQFSYNGKAQILMPLDTTGLSGNAKISLPQSSANIINDSLSVISDGADITKLFRHGEISLFGNGRMTVQAELAPQCTPPSSVHIIINEDTYSFDITSFAYSDTGLTLEGSVVYSDALITDIKAEKASVICAENSDIIFAADDCMLAGITTVRDSYELAKIIAESSGSYSRVMPDGRCMIYANRNTNTAYTPENVLKLSQANGEPVEAVVVTYGRSGSDYFAIEAVKHDRKQTADIYIYGDSGVKLSSDKGVLRKTSSGSTITLTEEITFDNGVGYLSKPATRVITENIKAEGKKITAQGTCFSMWVTYETVYDTYELTSETSGLVTLCAETINTLITLSGKSGRRISFDAPNICDRATASRIANKIIRESGTKTKLITTHSNIINTTNGIDLSTPYCKGFITSAKIIINRNPLMITNELEVI